MSRRLRSSLLLALVACLVAGCDDARTAAPPVTGPTTTTAVPSGVGRDLAGLRGTVPLVELRDDLRRRIAAEDPEAGADASAAVRPYDAVMIAALAAEVARTDAPSRIAAQVRGVTREGERCGSYQGCRQLTDVRTDIDYDGPSGDIELLDDGQSGDGSFSVLEVSATGALTAISSESADVPPPPDPVPVPDPSSGPRADGKLVIGMVLPTAGPAGPAGVAARAGIRVAVDEVNDDGGVVGRPVELVFGDAGDGSEDQVRAAAAVVLDAGADVVVGGLDPDDTAVLVARTVEAGVVLLSPGVPGTVASDLTRSGRFFRLSPPVAVQGAVLAAAAADDGATRVALVHGEDADGNAMATSFTEGFAGLGGTVVASIALGATDAAPGVADQVAAQDVEALIVAAGPGEAGALLRELRSRDRGPVALPTYVSSLTTSVLLSAE